MNVEHLGQRAQHTSDRRRRPVRWRLSFSVHGIFYCQPLIRSAWTVLRHSKKITDFLNTLTKVYLEKNLEKKNKIAFNTVKFIDSAKA